MLPPAERFSSRVENYIRYRPHYPHSIIECLQEQCGLTPESVVADVGSGTGILTELFLRNGNTVYGVEPNREMREAGERLLQGYERFHSVAATAEATTLPENIVDFVTAGTAFHWFDAVRTQAEFKRILKPNGWAVLVWNARRRAETPFSNDYEQLVETYSPEYKQADVKQRTDHESIVRFFDGNLRQARFDNHQTLNFEGLKGRLLSSSYSPEAGHPLHEPMLAELKRIFEDHQQNGQITLEYDTELYYGHLH